MNMVIKNNNCYIYKLFFISLIFLFSCNHHKVLKSTSVEKNTNTKVKIDLLKSKYATVLNVSESEITNEKLYQFIEEWYGVTYKYAGKDKKGIDCSGLTALLFKDVYGKIISSSSRALHAEVGKIKKTDLKEGDLVFFNIDSDKVSHVGVYLQNDKFVHASTKKGVIISNLDEPYYKKTFYSAGRIK